MRSLNAVANWLYGCRHRRTTFPITLQRDADRNGQHTKQAETYRVCLECGHHLAYDWDAMRLTRSPR
jgi:hypothetical protein